MTTKASNVTGPNINPILLISMQFSVKSRAKNRSMPLKLTPPWKSWIHHWCDQLKPTCWHNISLGSAEKHEKMEVKRLRIKHYVLSSKITHTFLRLCI